MAGTQRQKTHACPACNKAFHVKADCNAHLLKKHPEHSEAKKVPIFACTTCAQVFFSKSNCTRHITNVHDGGRILFCQHCQGTVKGSVNNRPDNITRHALTCPWRPSHLQKDKVDESDKAKECKDQAELDAKRKAFWDQTTPELPVLPPSPSLSPVIRPAATLGGGQFIDPNLLSDFNTPIMQTPLTPPAVSLQQQTFDDLPLDPVLLGSADANLLAGDMPTWPNLNDQFDKWHAAKVLLEQVEHEMGPSSYSNVLFRFIQLMQETYPDELHLQIMEAKKGIDQCTALFQMQEAALQ